MLREIFWKWNIGKMHRHTTVQHYTKHTITLSLTHTWLSEFVSKFRSAQICVVLFDRNFRTFFTPTLLLILPFYTFLVSQQAIFHRILILLLSRKCRVVLLLWSVFVVFVVVCNGCIVYVGCMLTLNSTKIRLAFSFLRKQFYTPLRSPQKRRSFWQRML